jgi:hypothetical protein
VQTYTSLSAREERIGRQSTDIITRQVSAVTDDPSFASNDEFDDEGDAKSAKQLAAWLFSAPSDIIRMNVEKRYTDAVALVIRCRAYVLSVLEIMRTPNGALTPIGSRAERGLQAVEQEVPNLASGILRALAKLPISPLFGSESQYRLLRLLVSLGHNYYEQAVHGFSLLQESIFRHMYASTETLLRSSLLMMSDELVDVNTAADTSPIVILSRTFFETLHSSTKSYLHLFAETAEGCDTEFGVYTDHNASASASDNDTTGSKGDSIFPEVVIRLLVRWMKGQLEGFALKIHQQVTVPRHGLYTAVM